MWGFFKCCGAGEVHNMSDETLNCHLTDLSRVYQIYNAAHTEAGEERASPPQCDIIFSLNVHADIEKRMVVKLGEKKAKLF